MSRSREAKMVNMPLGSTQWTGGFWGDRFKVFNTGRCGKREKVNGRLNGWYVRYYPYHHQ